MRRKALKTHTLDNLGCLFNTSSSRVYCWSRFIFYVVFCFQCTLTWLFVLIYVYKLLSLTKDFTQIYDVIFILLPQFWLEPKSCSSLCIVAVQVALSQTDLHSHSATSNTLQNHFLFCHFRRRLENMFDFSHTCHTIPKPPEKVLNVVIEEHKMHSSFLRGFCAQQQRVEHNDAIEQNSQHDSLHVLFLQETRWNDYRKSFKVGGNDMSPDRHVCVQFKATAEMKLFFQLLESYFEIFSTLVHAHKLFLCDLSSLNFNNWNFKPLNLQRVSWQTYRFNFRFELMRIESPEISFSSPSNTSYLSHLPSKVSGASDTFWVDAVSASYQWQLVRFAKSHQFCNQTENRI